MRIVKPEAELLLPEASGHVVAQDAIGEGRVITTSVDGEFETVIIGFGEFKERSQTHSAALRQHEIACNWARFWDNYKSAGRAGHTLVPLTAPRE